MRFEYDGEADALYVTLSTGVPARQDRLPDGTILDFDDVGCLLGVEVLSPCSQWDHRLGDLGLTTLQEAFLRSVAGIFRGFGFRPDPFQAAAGGSGQHVDLASAA